MPAVLPANGRVFLAATLPAFFCTSMAAVIVQAPSAVIEEWYRRLAAPRSCARSPLRTVWLLSIHTPQLWKMPVRHGDFCGKRELPQPTSPSVVIVLAAV